MSKEISCDECPKTFASRSGLSQHKQTQSGVKRSSCPKCNMSFTQNSKLKRHSLIHTGETPYQCTQCDFSCNRSHTLKLHTKKHTGENFTNAINATIRLIILPASKGTSRNTLGKICIIAINVNIKQHNQVPCKRTRRRTLVKSQTNAHHASIRVSQLVI